MKAWRVRIRENPDMTSIVFADTSAEAKETLLLMEANPDLDEKQVVL